MSCPKHNLSHGVNFYLKWILLYWIGAREKTNIDVGRSTDALSPYAKIDREKFFRQTFSTRNL